MVIGMKVMRMKKQKRGKIMKTIWKVLAWIFVICGLITYATGWIALFTKSVIWNIPIEFWFYNAISAGIIGLFFLIYSIHNKK